MTLARPAEQRAAMAAYQGFVVGSVRPPVETGAPGAPKPDTYGVLRNESLAHMQSEAGVLPSQAGERRPRLHCRDGARDGRRRPRRSRGARRPRKARRATSAWTEARRRAWSAWCSCRGGSGFAHISCLARQANIQFGQHLAANQRSNDTRDVFLRWVDCRLCEQTFHGPVAKAMARACVSTYASREPDDGVRISVMNASRPICRPTKLLTCREQILSDLQRPGADEASLIVLKTGLGRSYVDAGRHDDALAIFRRSTRGTRPSAAPSTMKRSTAPVI